MQTFSCRQGPIRVRNGLLLAVFALPCVMAVRPAQAQKPNVVWKQGKVGRQAIVAFSPDGKFVAVGTSDLKLRRTTDGKPVRDMGPPLRDGNGAINVVFSPDGQTLAAGGGPGTCRMWRTGSGQPIRELPGLSAAFSPDGQIIATGGKAKYQVRLWRTRDGSLLRTFPVMPAGLGNPVAFSPGGRLFAAADSVINLWRLDTGERVRAFPTKQHLNVGSPQIYLLAFSPDGRLLASAQGDTVQLWRVDDGTLLHTLTTHRGWCPGSLAFSPDGRYLLTGVFDPHKAGDERMGTLTFWRVRDGQRLKSYGPMKGGVWSVAFSPDGRLFAYGLNGPTVVARSPYAGRERPALAVK
jgi:WD40 repeat protein